MDKPPSTIEEILATAAMDPEFEAAWKDNGSPPGQMPSDIAAFQKTVLSTLPGVQKMLAASRPAGVIETEHSISIDDNFSSRTIVCRSSLPIAEPSPVVVLIHGGGHCLGFPEMELITARELVLTCNATCILPSYRLAPGHPFPANVNDIYAVVAYIADHAVWTDKSILPTNIDLKKGFILGGLSAGAGISSNVAHLARDRNLDPSLTGLFLACGVFINPDRVPDRFRRLHLSLEQNKNAPILNTSSLKQFLKAYRGDITSRQGDPFSFDQHHPDGIAAGHKNLPPVYFQVAGMDPARDDSLIYERVLREESQVPTRLNMYSGFPHGFWAMYPSLEATKLRMKDTVRGFRWLLGDDAESEL